MAPRAIPRNWRFVRVSQSWSVSVQLKLLARPYRGSWGQTPAARRLLAGEGRRAGGGRHSAVRGGGGLPDQPYGASQSHLSEVTHRLARIAGLPPEERGHSAVRTNPPGRVFHHFSHPVGVRAGRPGYASSRVFNYLALVVRARNGPLRLPKLNVAGWNPVSCSRKLTGVAEVVPVRANS